MNEYSKNVVRRRHIGKNHTTLGPEYFFRTSAPARIFRPRPAVSGGIFGRGLGPEKIFSRPRVVLYIPDNFYNLDCFSACFSAHCNGLRQVFWFSSFSLLAEHLLNFFALDILRHAP